jgi:hypothetical protein
MDLRKCILTAAALMLNLTAPAGRAANAESVKTVDELIAAGLVSAGVPASEICSDNDFLRRVYLDVIGMLPTPDEARAFVADKDPLKRTKLIDRLLARDEFADYWAMQWGDLLRIKSEYPVRVWPKGVQAYHRWVRESIASAKPYDRFVREMLVSSGSNFRDGPANFYRAVNTKDPQTFAEQAALVFMGARLSCSRCHAHPTEKWTLDDDLGMAAFFAQVRFKNTSEWKEEIVYLDPDAVLRNPTTKKVVKAKFLGGPEVELASGEDARARFADWLISPDNPWFAANAVNRIWARLMGRGIVNEPDDLRPGNRPSHPELLAFLARDFAARGYDMRHVYRTILNSQAYQRSSRANDQNRGDLTHYSHYLTRRLGAEQLLDALSQVTQTSEVFASSIPEPFTRLPRDMRAVQIADGSITTPFLDLFGRPPRDTAYERDRCNDTSVRQALHLLNSSDLERKVTGSERIKRLLNEKKTDREIIDEFYLAALSRHPTQSEQEKLMTYLSAGAGKDRSRPQALQDVLWAIVNTQEFLFNH